MANKAGTKASKIAPRQVGSYSREDGYFVWRYEYGGRAGRKSVVRKRRTLDALHAAVKEALDELERTGRLLQASDVPTVEQRFHQWMEGKVRPFRTQRTVEDYEYKARYIIACIGSVKVNRLTSDHVQGMIGKLMRHEVGSLGPASIHGVLRVLSAMLGRKTWSEIGSEIVRPPAAQPRTRVLTQTELQAFLDELFRETVNGYAVYDARWAIQFALNTGLRESELCGLTWFAIDFENRTSSIVQQLGRDGKEIVRVKSRSGERVLALNDHAMEALAQERIQQRLWRERGGFDGTGGWAFPSRTGSPRSQRNLLRTVQTVAERAGIHDLNMHDLRRTYLTSLAEAHVPEAVTQAIAGHASATTTRRHYIHARQQAMQDAATKVSIGRTGT